MTPVKPQVLSEFLKRFPDQEERFWLVRGFEEGFKIGYEGPRTARDCQNLLSARNREHLLWSKVLKEIKLGRYAGPFKSRPLPNLICSPLGLVPKHSEEDTDPGGEGKDMLDLPEFNDPTRVRMITHLSHPRGDSINSHIPESCSKIEYETFDEAIKMCLKAGPGAFIAKSDVQSAFRQIPIHPQDIELLGFKVRNMYLVDLCLPFGLASSPNIFERFARALEWIVKRETGHSITHYLDDFFFCGTNPSGCNADLDAFIGICERLGLPVSMEKTFRPSTCLSYLGLEIDTVSQTVGIPLSKKKKAVRLIARLL